MKTTFVLLSLFLFALIIPGCSSSSSSDGGQDMSQMAAALDQKSATAAASAAPAAQSSTAAPAAAAPASAGTAPAPATAAAVAPAVAADPSLRTKRGFGLKDWSNEATYVLVKADAEKTANALARAWNGKVVKNVFGQPSNDAQLVVYQLAGHSWSIFACHGSQVEPLSKDLISDADVMFIWNSDFNGWSGCDVYRAGQEVEAVHWGPDGDGLGEDADVAKWHARGKIGTNIEGGGYDEAYQFRSKTRKVADADLQKGEAFVDAFLRHHDAYLPDADQMPWSESEESETVTSPLGLAAFAAVHAVEVPDR
jgi:hypothetical protein